ncbi:hypothetical protein [Paenibacillus sonchi]|uniref:hypothetical protein n=1 Tax=Paenibacillus sonchi TaxID=373687 RepID=UPI001E5C5C99|nr:hypothetical protein [Paenibacillus sonchi]MCE3204111.1 hypothetical protein [Paenibacillus sonchi]
MQNRSAFQHICEDIHHYMIDILSNCIDPDIFSCSTLEDLGELYFQKILAAISESTEDHIKALIRTLVHKNMTLECEDDFYKNICHIMWIRSLPKTQYLTIKTIFNDTFGVKYPLVLSLAQTERTKLVARIEEINASENFIRQAVSAAKSLTYDLETDENKLYELDIARKLLETQIEMYDWQCEYLTAQLSDFCDFNNPCAVDEKLKFEALRFSKEVDFQIDTLFSPFEDNLSITEDIFKRPHTVFYKVKFYAIWAKAYALYRQDSFIAETVDIAIEQYKSDLLSIPSFDDLHDLKKSNPSEYLISLQSCIQTYDILGMVERNIDAGICLRNRKKILKKALKLYANREFELFDNIAPIQIEGMFSDFLKDTTIFNRFSNPQIYPTAVLREKIHVLQQCSNSLYPEAIQYFKFYFNNMVRNKIAHGSYQSIYGNSEEAEIFACETLLDLNFMVYMLSRESESERMYRFLHDYKARYAKLIKGENPHFGALFNDLSGEKLVIEYDHIQKYRPIQVAYWLVNPYYEKIYTVVADKDELLDLRCDFLSQSFWEYVIDKLKNNLAEGCYLTISREMKSVVSGLFRCDISDDLSYLLREVIKQLNLIDAQGGLK